MGYDHRWTRPDQLPAEAFASWSADVAQVIVKTDVPLVGIDLSAKPIVTSTLVAFNGDPRSFRTMEDYIRFWVSRGMDHDEAAYYAQWYDGGGAQQTFSLSQVAAGGIRAVMAVDETMTWYCESCKTQKRPYDEVVTAALALLAYRFPRLCYVTSDGKAKNWRNGLNLVERSLGLRLKVPSYRHWWRCPPQNNREAFAAWRDDIIQVIAIANVPVGGPKGFGPPIISPSLVSLNGVADDACDPFTVESQRAPYFHNCHTGQRPYDIVVTAAVILLTYHYRHLVLSQRLPGGKPVITDGEAPDWEPGLILAQQATGRDLEIPWLD